MSNAFQMKPYSANAQIVNTKARVMGSHKDPSRDITLEALIFYILLLLCVASPILPLLRYPWNRNNVKVVELEELILGEASLRARGKAGQFFDWQLYNIAPSWQ